MSPANKAFGQTGYFGAVVFGGTLKNMHMPACNQTEIKENMNASRFDQC